MIQWRYCKVRIEGDKITFNPYFYVPKYRSSDALPAPENFTRILSISYNISAAVTFLLQMASIHSQLTIDICDALICLYGTYTADNLLLV